MRVVARDLDLDHLWVVYPGELEYPLGDRFTAIPLPRAMSLRLARGEGPAPEA